MERNVLKIIDRMIDERYAMEADAFKYHYAHISYINKLYEEIYALSAARQALKEQKTRVNC